MDHQQFGENLHARERRNLRKDLIGKRMVTSSVRYKKVFVSMKNRIP